MKSCNNCKNRFYESWSGFECCIIYEMIENDEEAQNEALNCDMYEEETEEDIEYRKGNYYSSSTNGDYSPSNPWNAPGMSIHDFI